MAASLLEPTNKRMKQRHNLTFVRDAIDNGGKPRVLEIDQQDYHALEKMLRNWCDNNGCNTIDALKGHNMNRAKLNRILRRDHPDSGEVTTHVRLDQTGRVTSFFHCMNTYRIPASLFDLDGLRNLELCWEWDGNTDFEVIQIPNEIRTLVNLEELRLTIDRSLEISLPQDVFQGLKNLKLLHLETGHTELPREIGALEKLEELEIECPLDMFPSEMQNLANLKTLCFSCLIVESLPDSIGLLYSLKKLTIQHSRELDSLPESIGLLRSLEELIIKDCEALTALPDSIGLLRSLKELIIEDCDDIASLPDSIGYLQSLEVLDICFDNLRVSPTFLGNLSNLTDLDMVACQYSLDHRWIHCDVSFFDSLKLLTKLTKLTVAASHLLWIPPSLFASCKDLSNVTIVWDFFTSLTPTLFERICTFMPSVERLTIKRGRPCKPSRDSSWPLKFYLNSKEISVPFPVGEMGLPEHEVLDIPGYPFFEWMNEPSWARGNASLSLPKLRVLSLEAPCPGFCDKVLLSSLHLPKLEEFTYCLIEQCSFEYVRKKLMTGCPSLKQVTIHAIGSFLIPPRVIEALLLLPTHFFLATEDQLMGPRSANQQRKDVDHTKNIRRLGFSMSINRARTLLQHGKRLYSALWPLILEQPCNAFRFPMKIKLHGHHFKFWQERNYPLAGITEDADAIFVLLRERAFQDL